MSRASMKSVSRRRSRNLPLRRLRARNHKHTGICVDLKSCPGSATMQSTRSASKRFLRISPSLDCADDIEPLARTNPAAPRGDR